MNVPPSLKPAFTALATITSGQQAYQLYTEQAPYVQQVLLAASPTLRLVVVPFVKFRAAELARRFSRMSIAAFCRELQDVTVKMQYGMLPCDNTDPTFHASVDSLHKQLSLAGGVSRDKARAVAKEAACGKSVLIATDSGKFIIYPVFSVIN